MPSAVQKSRVTPTPLSTPKSGPRGPLFRRVDNAAFVNRAPPHFSGGFRSATKFGLLLRSSAPHKNSCRCSAAEPFTGFAAPPAAAAAAYISRVSGSVATKLRFCFVWLSDTVFHAANLPRSITHHPGHHPVNLPTDLQSQSRYYEFNSASYSNMRIRYI